MRFLRKNEGMEIWLAPIADGIAAPVSVEMPTPLGSLVLSVTRLSLQ